MVLLWAVVIVFMVIVEVSTFQFISVWFAVGGIFALITALMDMSFAVQLTVFVISSVILLIVTFPLGRKLNNFRRVSTNVEMNVGKFATVIEEIDIEKGTGRVRLNGVDWKAVSSDGSIIPSGSVVTVDEVKSTKLTVTLKKDTVKV